MSSFSRGIDKAYRGIVDAHKDLVRLKMNEGFEGTTARSPVDKGHFKESWNVTIDSPDLAVVPSNVSLRATFGSARKAPPLRLPDFPLVYIANGQTYGPDLENGKSPLAAPGGIVAITMAELAS